MADNDHDLLIEAVTILKDVKKDIEEIREIYATKEFVRLEIEKACKENKPSALSAFWGTRTGIAVIVIVITLAAIGLLGIMGQESMSREEMLDLINQTNQSVLSAPQSGGTQ